jgi:heptose I phosphotransferase
LTGTISLENFCRNWPESPPDHVLKRRLIRETARIARTMHESGINHRDLYLCHFLWDISYEGKEEASRSLYLIDLHRAQIRSKTPLRWKIKDLAGLYFSSMDIGLTQNDLFYFIKSYKGASLKEALAKDNVMWRKVTRRAELLYMKTWKRAPAHPFAVSK